MRRPRSCTLFGYATALACSAVVRAAAAQDATPTPATAMLPLLTPLRLRLLPSEPTAPDGTPLPSLVSLPIEVSLMSSVFPVMPGILGQDCRAGAEASGNTVWGFSTQHAAYLPLTRRLTLHGFSQVGCALDSAMGGAVTYMLPLDDDLALVGSAGFIVQPSFPGAGTLKTDARFDLLMNRSTRHPFAVGVDLRRQGFSFSGAW